jgi:hypothetical protein
MNRNMISRKGIVMKNAVVRYSPAAANFTMILACTMILVAGHWGPYFRIFDILSEIAVVIWPILAAIGWLEVQRRQVRIARIAQRMPLVTLSIGMLYSAAYNFLAATQHIWLWSPSSFFNILVLIVGVSNVAAVVPNVIRMRSQSVKMLGCGQHGGGGVPATIAHEENSLLPQRPLLIAGYCVTSMMAMVAMTAIAFNLLWYDSRQLAEAFMTLMMAIWFALAPAVGEQFVRHRSRLGLATMFTPLIFLLAVRMPSQWLLASMMGTWFCENLLLLAKTTAVSAKERVAIGKQRGWIAQKAGISPIDEPSKH